MSNSLFFTSTVSTHLIGATTSFQGLYQCDFNRITGQCDNAELVVDVYNENGEHHRGLDLMNVEIDKVHNKLYSGYYDGDRDGFEILRAPLTSPIKFESFFRVDDEYSNTFWGGRNCLMDCCEGAGKSYHNILPRDYIVDDGDIFVSWDGFYQDCTDEFLSPKGLQWTIGVSKILQNEDCIFTSGAEPVDFASCTEPVSIVFQGGTARREILGYSGLAISDTPGGNKLFFLSVLADDLDANKERSLLSSVWTAPLGGNFAKDPKVLTRMVSVEVDTVFKTLSVDDVGTLVLELNEDRTPKALCRTAYDVGVFCYDLQIDEEEDYRIHATNEKQYVTQEQVRESCTIPELSHYPITKTLPPVLTGLEVFWDEFDSSENVESIVFGCYGEINGHGNFTTVFADGTLEQTLPFAYPGSILLGKDVGFVAETLHDSPGAILPKRLAEPEPSHSSPLFMVFAVGCVAVIVFEMKKKTLDRWEPTQVYQTINQTDSMGTDGGAYVELSVQPSDPTVLNP